MGWCGVRGVFLKGIAVQGFKSFADKIELEFGSGITAIVGPNGSGKSNVSDAIRWVLGEQSAKSLRGGSMQDVIFAGTAKRKPLGFAQVSIVLDNTDRIFPVDADEVRVTRRVHRSGEGEYAINNTPCRLKDVHELFMDTGLGREGYSIIGQGKIDEILSSKSEDRRHIFEEAAGITKYKYRKSESERKLTQTEENLVRIRDLLSAMEEQLGPLESQSKKARQYLDLRERFKGLDISIALHNIDKQRDALEKGRKIYADTFGQLNEEKKKAQQCDTQAEQMEEALRQLLDATNAKREQLFELEKNSGSLHGRIELLKSNAEHNHDNHKRLMSEAAELDSRIAAADQASQTLAAQLEGFQKEHAAQSADLERLRAEAAGLEQEIAALQTEIEQKKGDIVELLSETGDYRAKLSGLEALARSFAERKDTILTDLEEKKRQIASQEQQIQALEAELAENNTKKEGFLHTLDQLKASYQAISADMERLKAEQNQRITQYNEKQSKKKILEELEKGYEGYYKSVKSVLKQGFHGVHGAVSKLLTVEASYVTAIEIALGSAIQHVVVDTEADAKACISFLKQNRLGRATFLPLSTVRGNLLDKPPAGEAGYLGLASELIGYDPKYEGVFRQLLGRVVVADNIDHAIAIARKTGYRYRIVTLSGELVNAGGSMTGGSIRENQQLLSRAKDIEQLHAELAVLKKELNKYDNQIDTIHQKIQEIAGQKQICDDGVSACSHQQVRLSSELEHGRAMLESLERSMGALSHEQGGIGREQEDIASQREAHQQQIAVREEQITQVRAAITQQQTALDGLLVRKDALSNDVTERQMVYNDLKKDILIAEEQQKTIAANRANSLKEREQKQQEAAELLNANAALEQEIQSIYQQAANTKDGAAALAGEIEQAEAAYAADETKWKACQKTARDIREGIYVLQQEVARLEHKNERIESDMEQIISRLWDDYELTYSAALPFRAEDIRIADATKEAASLRSQMKALGNINLDAIDEYRAVREKYDFMAGQRQDLEDAKRKLEGIISQMQSVMTEQFQKSFSTIQERFNAVFQELFGGGSGKLSLTDPQHVLESGIDIEVQPPGKKLQNLMALSGGERAFAAIALLFAVLEVRPTPFCILDEVEAALDDVNVYRFADYVRKYSEKTQFIVVTHRRGTMEAADILYGVTMQEKGVSKLLKLKFEDLEDYHV